jgi:hypothetical protein
MSLPPETHKMSPGGPYDKVECDRCGSPATRSYEGEEFLSLCENCWIALGSFLDQQR